MDLARQLEIVVRSDGYKSPQLSMAHQMTHPTRLARQVLQDPAKEPRKTTRYVKSYGSLCHEIVAISHSANVNALQS